MDISLGTMPLGMFPILLVVHSNDPFSAAWARLLEVALIKVAMLLLGSKFCATTVEGLFRSLLVPA